MRDAFGVSKSAPKGLLRLNPIGMENETAFKYVSGRQRAHTMGRKASRAISEVQRANPGVPKRELPFSAAERAEKLADSGGKAASRAKDALANMDSMSTPPRPRRSKRFDQLSSKYWLRRYS